MLLLLRGPSHCAASRTTLPLIPRTRRNLGRDRTLKILIVDDEPLNVDYLEQELEGQDTTDQLQSMRRWKKRCQRLILLT